MAKISVKKPASTFVPVQKKASVSAPPGMMGQGRETSVPPAPEQTLSNSPVTDDDWLMKSPLFTGHHLLQKLATPVSESVSSDRMSEKEAETSDVAVSSTLPVQAKLTIGAPGDVYEQEADRVAAQVVQRIHAPESRRGGEGQVQRQEMGDEEEVRLKSLGGTLQRVEISQLNLKSESENPREASADLEVSIQGARGSGQPLDESVREPMQREFGADFSGVRVHTDGKSDALNQSIQAKAFTTGQDVFFRQGAYEPGSRGGQELLAHELTHVVQQSGGMVQRSSWESREEPLLRGYSEKSPVIQLKPEWKKNNHPDSFLDVFVGALDNLVTKAAELALNPDDLVDLDGYVTLWKDTAIILKAIADEAIDTDNSDEVAEAKAAESFAAARYGYAVESLACSQKSTLQSNLPNTCEFYLQAGRGMTRPDIIVVHKTRGEIAWLDITSSGSIGHIDKKTGSGWKTKLYVAEIVYTPLDKSKIGTGKLSIGEKVARKNSLKRRIKAWEEVQKGFQRKFTQEWKDEEGDKITNKAKRATLTREIIEKILGNMPSPIEAKSILRAVSWSIKDYGFDQGGTKAEGETILRNIYGA